MSQRADKALLLFNVGEVTPLLAGRTDVEKITAGCRTLQNMVVDIGGGATRRAGTEFIAGTKAVVPLTFESLEGTAEYYGVTELTDVTDPPRKYLELHPNRGEIRRSGATTPAFDYIQMTEMVKFTTAGTKTNRLQIREERPGASGIGAYDTAEAFVFKGDYSPHPMAWVKSKRHKYTTEPETRPSGEGALDIAWHTGVQGDTTTANGDTLLRVAWPQWKTTYWECVISFSAATSVGTLMISLSGGDSDPGDPETSGIVYSGEGTFTLQLPPDVSARFWVRASTWGTEWDGVTFPANFVELFPAPWTVAGLADADLPMWFYFPSGSGYAVDGYMDLNDGVRRYEERLAVEDTLEAAMLRSSDLVTGTESIATTTALTGGITAESHAPIQWAGRVVKATKIFTGLTAGHTYSVSVLVRTNTIGLTDHANSLDATGADFTAVAPTHAYTFEVRAPLGFERQALDMSASDLGADSVPADYDTDTILYWGRVLLAGGTLSAAELTIANDLVTALKAASLWDKLCYFLPLLGGFNGIFVPLRDRDTAGNATNTAFVSGDYTLATGLQGNGSSKIITIPRTGAELGTGNNGGLGYWELSVSYAGTANQAPMGNQLNPGGGTRVYQLLVGAAARGFYWGFAANVATNATAGGNGYHHGERLSTTSRRYFFNGAFVVTNTTADTSSGVGTHDLRFMGMYNALTPVNAYWAGRSGACLLTDGTLSDANVTTLYETLRDELLTPTGRI